MSLHQLDAFVMFFIVQAAMNKGNSKIFLKCLCMDSYPWYVECQQIWFYIKI